MSSAPAGMAEVELKFLVPARQRSALLQALATRAAGLSRRSLAAVYLDTPDRHLARAGIAWRMRREGHRWVQALKAGDALQRFEHEAVAASAEPDPLRHAGTPAGERLIECVRKARADGVEPVARFATRIRRTSRRIRTRGTVVELAFDEGRIVAGAASERVCELEFELVSGSARVMVELAQGWQRRFGLIVWPQTKAERGDRLASGRSPPHPRKALPPAYEPSASLHQAVGAVFDECFAQVLGNMAALVGGGGQDAEIVHQLRVGVRRLRSALRLFDGWVEAPPESLVDELRAVFAELGVCRDQDVHDTGIAAALAAAGAPPLPSTLPKPARCAAEVVRAGRTQAQWLGWIAWRGALLDADAAAQAAAARAAAAAAAPPAGGDAADAALPQQGRAAGAAAGAARSAVAPGAAGAAQTRTTPPADWVKSARRRLRRWHRQCAAAGARFAELDEASMHRLRRRVKRLRYAAEFLAPVLKRRALRRFLKAIEPVQEYLGELNDLVVARERYARSVQAQPEAWFALGFVAARIAAVRASVAPALAELARCGVPERRRDTGRRKARA